MACIALIPGNGTHPLPALHVVVGLSRVEDRAWLELTVEVMHYRRSVTEDVVADGAELVSHACSASVAFVGDESGLTGHARRLAEFRQRRCGHGSERVSRDPRWLRAPAAGACRILGTLCATSRALFGRVASHSTTLGSE